MMLLLTIAVLLNFISFSFGGSQPQDHGQTRPNILFIFTDDQDLELGSMQYLPTVRSRIVDQGKEAFTCFQVSRSNS